MAKFDRRSVFAADEVYSVIEQVLGNEPAILCRRTIRVYTRWHPETSERYRMQYVTSGYVKINEQKLSDIPFHYKRHRIEKNEMSFHLKSLHLFACKAAGI